MKTKINKSQLFKMAWSMYKRSISVLGREFCQSFSACLRNAWFKMKAEARFAALEGEKVSNLRKAKLEALLKDTGTFGSRTLKSFSKMNFESDDDFEEFYSDVEEDLKNYNQERADAGLATLATPPAAGSKGSGKQDEVLTDKEVEDLVNTF